MSSLSPVGIFTWITPTLCIYSVWYPLEIFSSWTNLWCRRGGIAGWKWMRARLLAQLRRPNHRLHLELCAYYFALSTPSPINLARRERPTLVSRWAAAGCAMSGVQGGSPTNTIQKNGARGVERKESLAPTHHMQHSGATLPTLPNKIQTYISMQRAKIYRILNIFG